MGLPTATVRMRGPDGIARTSTGMGTGPVDAAYKAIDSLVRVQVHLGPDEALLPCFTVRLCMPANYVLQYMCWSHARSSHGASALSRFQPSPQSGSLAPQALQECSSRSMGHLSCHIMGASTSVACST